MKASARRLRWHGVVASLLVLIGTVAGGTLECGPLKETRAVAHGRETYARMCAVCHGPTGEGYLADQAPALANPAFLATVEDPFLDKAIALGRAGSTMSAWGVERGGPLARADVAAVIAFLRSWQTGPVTSVDDAPLAGDATRGAATFAAECARCHGARGLGGLYESIGNPELLDSASNGFLRAAVLNGRPGTKMPAFAATLGKEGTDDVLHFLRASEPNPAVAPPRLQAPAKPPPLPLGPVPLHPRGPEPQGFVPTFTKADVVEAQLQRGARMAILDARAPSDYTGTHIKGAVSVPFYDPEPYFDLLPRDAWLVCYCGCPHAESGQLATKLRAKGFTKVTVIDEGLRYWQKQKYATETGALP